MFEMGTPKQPQANCTRLEDRRGMQKRACRPFEIVRVRSAASTSNAASSKEECRQHAAERERRAELENQQAVVSGHAIRGFCQLFRSCFKGRCGPLLRRAAGLPLALLATLEVSLPPLRLAKAVVAQLLPWLGEAQNAVCRSCQG